MCYLMILLVTGSSIEPTIFHASHRASLHVGLLQHLYLTYSLERHNTHIHRRWNTSCSQWWKNFILSSRKKSHPSHNDGIFPYFYPGRNTSYSQWWNISILSSRLESHPAHSDRIFLHLHPSRWEHILLTEMKVFHTFIQDGITSCSQWWKGSALTSDLVGTKSYTLIKRACTHIWPGRN